MQGSRVWMHGALAIALALAIGCGKDKASGNHAGTGGSSGTSGGSGGATGGGGGTGGGTGGTGGTSAGPAISEAPPSWERPADCGGIGELCPSVFDCAERAMCQAIGNVCVPAIPAGGSLPSKSATHPYCAAFTCMTFEEASCFCTGPAGERYANCSSPRALAGLCVGRGTSCNAQDCCEGLSCVDAGGGSRVCEVTCTSDEACETGCCTDLRDTGVMVCAAPAACENPCRKRGESCEAAGTATGSTCCRGTCVNSENPNFAGCRPTCTTHDQCPDTGCCVPFSNSDRGFCADAIYCSCGSAGDPCGRVDTPRCCEGNECTGSVGSFTCNPRCTEHAECATQCCAPIQGADFSVCLGPEYCS